MIYGVDIHGTYQRGIDFSQLARQGYSFAAVKATQGTTEFHASYTQQFLDWIPQIRAAGLIPGAYHWLTNADPIAQCANFLRRVRQAGGPNGMLIQCDCEDNATLPVLQGWVKEWSRQTGGHPFFIYSGAWWWQSRGWNGAQFAPYLWDSRYLTADTDSIPDDPAAFATKAPASWWTPRYGGWPTTTILQFTSKGDAGSLPNNVDLNAYRGTRAELLALTGTTPAQPKPPEDKKMLVLTKDNAGALWLCDGMTCRPVNPAEVGDLKYLSQQGAIGPLWQGGKVWEGLAAAHGTKVQTGQPPVPVIVADGAAEVIADLVSGKMAELFAGLDVGKVDGAAVTAALRDGGFLTAVAKAVNDDAAARAAE